MFKSVISYIDVTQHSYCETSVIEETRRKAKLNANSRHICKCHGTLKFVMSLLALKHQCPQLLHRQSKQYPLWCPPCQSPCLQLRPLPKCPRNRRSQLSLSLSAIRSENIVRHSSSKMSTAAKGQRSESNAFS